MGKVSKSPGKGEKRIGKVGKKNGKSNAPTEGSNSGKASRFTMSERNLGLMQEIIRKDPESYKEVRNSRKNEKIREFWVKIE